MKKCFRGGLEVFIIIYTDSYCVAGLEHILQQLFQMYGSNPDNKMYEYVMKASQNAQQQDKLQMQHMHHLGKLRYLRQRLQVLHNKYLSRSRQTMEYLRQAQENVVMNHSFEDQQYFLIQQLYQQLQQNARHVHDQSQEHLKDLAEVQQIVQEFQQQIRQIQLVEQTHGGNSAFQSQIPASKFADQLLEVAKSTSDKIQQSIRSHDPTLMTIAQTIKTMESPNQNNPRPEKIEDYKENLKKKKEQQDKQLEDFIQQMNERWKRKSQPDFVPLSHKKQQLNIDDIDFVEQKRSPVQSKLSSFQSKINPFQFETNSQKDQKPLNFAQFFYQNTGSRQFSSKQAYREIPKSRIYGYDQNMYDPLQLQQNYFDPSDQYPLGQEDQDPQYSRIMSESR